MNLPDDPVILKAVGFAAFRKLLSRVNGRVSNPIWVEASDRSGAQITVRSDDELAIPPRLPCCSPEGQTRDDMLSLLELLVAVCFGHDEREIILAAGSDELPGLAIAKRLDPTKGKVDTRLKILLANLADRRVYSKGDGYLISDPRLLEIARGGNPLASFGRLTSG